VGPLGSVFGGLGWLLAALGAVLGRYLVVLSGLEAVVGRSGANMLIFHGFYTGFGPPGREVLWGGVCSGSG